MIISVAMATYNGSKYIIKQLDSIRLQSHVPDEVIICDDGSKDNTVELIRNYIEIYNLENWKIDVNSERLGWKQNFRKAISKCVGDIIFFSDQDDIWNRDKISIMSGLMIRKNMGCLYGKSIAINEYDKIIKKRTEQKKYSYKAKRINLTQSFYTVGSLGCCMGVSRQVIDKYLELNCEYDDHDSQCPRIAVLYDTLWCIDAPVIKYRIHSKNTSGISKEYTFGTSTLAKRINNINEISKWLLRVKEDKVISASKDKVRLVDEAINTENERVQFLSNRNVCICRILKHYRSYSGVSMFIGDIAYKYGLNKVLGKLRWKLERSFF